MDSFEINKIISAIIVVVVLIVGIDKLSEVIFHIEKPKTPGYVVEVQKVSTSSNSTETTIDIAGLMAMGSSEDGKKIRRALMFKKASESLTSIVNFKGDDKRDVGVKGHTFVATPNHTYAIEMTSEHKPVIKKLNRKQNHVRTNHGYDYEDSGYTSGLNKKSSELRWKYAQDMLSNVKSPEDVLNGLSAYHAKNMRNNPYRNADKVDSPTEKDILSTTGQLMLNITDLEMTLRMDKDKSEYFGIDDRTPDSYEPKIKIKVEYVKNKKIKK